MTFIDDMSIKGTIMEQEAWENLEIRALNKSIDEKTSLFGIESILYARSEKIVYDRVMEIVRRKMKENSEVTFESALKEASLRLIRRIDTARSESATRDFLASMTNDIIIALYREVIDI